jgi:hypothetical protein
MLEDYYWQTGDISLIKRYRNTIDEILEWFSSRVGSLGLGEKLYYWEFIDWVEEWQDERGFVSGVPQAAKTGPCTTTNLIYAAALQCGARLMTLAERPYLSDVYNRRAENILLCVEHNCWDSEKGLYAEGPGVSEYTQHAQAFAVLTGLARGARADDILKKALDRELVLECTFVFSYFLFRAYEAAGLYGLTRPLWDKWLNMLPFNVTTWPEDITRQRSDCHGWGSLPVYEFVRCFLGVKPSKPGWECIQISPICEYVNDMKGVAITPKGMVEVEWRKTDHACVMEGYSPEGVPLHISLPGGHTYHFENGGSFSISLP